jgi:glycosyltransferase involved in cell wall biosynthesis
VRALRSLLVQPQLLEAIVVVDGRLDDTAEVVAGIRDARIRVIEHAVNQGAQRSRNAGLAVAQAASVMFLDADDYHEGSVLCGLTDVMAAHNADLGFAPMQIERGPDGLREPEFQPAWSSAQVLFQQWFVQRRYVAPAAVLWRTDYVRTLGGWDETVEKNQDGELVMRAALSGARIAVSRQGRAIYVRAGGETVSSRPDNLGSLLRVSEKVLATPSSAVDDETRRRACALHDYRIAWDCFERGADALGAVALARSRELGFHGHRGPLPHRLLAHFVGLRRKCIVVEGAKRLIGLPNKRWSPA